MVWSAGFGAAELRAVFDAVVARSDSAYVPTSAVASILRRPAPGMRAEVVERGLGTAASLDGLVAHWLRQRLWSLNRAPELVAHDERHVAAVEGLIAVLVEPFWTRRLGPPAFLPEELGWLSVAAWLHDWGHVGGMVAPWRIGGADAIVGSSRDVRVLHGLISQHLLGPAWVGMHGVEPSMAGPAAVLCGHHQSWTSFGRERPAVAAAAADDSKPDPVALLAELGVKPVTLEEDIGALEELPPFVGLARFRLLVALLRVADGADVGRHRVPDIGAGRNGFLARCIHQEAMRTAEVLRFVSDHDPRAQAGIEIAHMVALEALQAGRGDPEVLVTPIETAGIPEIEELVRYRAFVHEQGKHFDKHQLVDSVSFAFVDGAFDVIVVPSEDAQKLAEKAVDEVAKDVRCELDKAGVGAVLADNGIRFRKARTPRPFARPAERALAGPWVER